MTNRQTIDQEYFSPASIAIKAGISRCTVYNLNKRHHFIRKLGSRSLIRWTDFEAALLQETDAEAKQAE